MDFCPKRRSINIGTSLTIDTEIDWPVLKDAIYQAYSRCESMRLRFVKDKKDGTWYQYVVDKEERDIEFVDFSGVYHGGSPRTMQKWTQVPLPNRTLP